jgi:hypothetical protein
MLSSVLDITIIMGVSYGLYLSGKFIMGKMRESNERIEFYFPSALSNLLKNTIPARERSRFVADATEKELKRILFQKKLQSIGHLKKDTHEPGVRPAWRLLREHREEH